MQISIQTRHLKAAACCAATQDVRYYLNGVFVEIMRSEVRLVATNGSMVAVLRDVNLVGTNPDMPHVIIPNATIKQARMTKMAALDLTFDPDPEHWGLRGQWDLGGVRFTPVEGVFPDYRRIIPTKTNGEAAQFAPEFVAAFAKVAATLGRKHGLIIRHDGPSNGAQVQVAGCEDEFVGVIMSRCFTKKNPDPGMSQWGAERAK